MSFTRGYWHFLGTDGRRRRLGELPGRGWGVYIGGKMTLVMAEPIKDNYSRRDYKINARNQEIEMPIEMSCSIIARAILSG